MSTYQSSRWLSQYFLNQVPLENEDKQQRTAPKKKKEYVMATTDCQQQQQQESIISKHHVHLDETLTFSPFPRYVLHFEIHTYAPHLSHTQRRVLVEAHAPHQIVHANAAFFRTYGFTKPLQLFAAPKALSQRELELAILASLFANHKSHNNKNLTMYPVWGSDREADGTLRFVTHYLVEAREASAVVESNEAVVESAQKEEAVVEGNDSKDNTTTTPALGVTRTVG